jgi:hypothetical protein
MKAHLACFHTLLIIGLIFEKRLKLAFGDERQRIVKAGKQVLHIRNAVAETADQAGKIHLRCARRWTL